MNIGTISIIAGFVSFCAFGASILDTPLKFPKDQAIYWFILSLASFLLPHIKAIRFKDLEVEIGNLAEAVAAPDLQEKPSKDRPELEVHALQALKNDRWASRTTSGVVGEVSAHHSVTRVEVKSVLKKLKNDGLVVRLKGNKGRLYWALSSRGRGAAGESA